MGASTLQKPATPQAGAGGKTIGKVVNRKSAKFKEVHTGDLPVGQHAPVNLGSGEEPLKRPEPRMESIPSDLLKDKDHMAKIRFAEDAVAILIQPGSEEFAPKYADIWVQGRGPEVGVTSDGRKAELISEVARWVHFLALPIGMRVVTKRKYVEVLARARRTTYRTQHHVPGQNQDAVNELLSSTHLAHPFSVYEDAAGDKGTKWLQLVLANRL